MNVARWAQSVSNLQVRRFSGGKLMGLHVYVKNCNRCRTELETSSSTGGDEGDVMFIVGEGEIQLTLDDGPATAREGESFGEMSIIDNHPRSADATAVTDVKLYPVNRGLFLVLVQETPHFALEVMKSLTDRLRKANALRAA